MGRKAATKPNVIAFREPSEDASKKVYGVVVGSVLRVATDGAEVVVGFQGSPPTGVQARCAVELRPGDTGREITLMFEHGDIEKPIITGFLRHLGDGAALQGSEALVNLNGSTALDVSIDGERVVLSAQREIVLQCGEASLILTQDGRVILKGSYVLSRSSGANKIKGGTVQIN